MSLNGMGRPVSGRKKLCADYVIALRRGMFSTSRAHSIALLNEAATNAVTRRAAMPAWLPHGNRAVRVLDFALHRQLASRRERHRAMASAGPKTSGTAAPARHDCRLDRLTKHRSRSLTTRPHPAPA